MKTKLVLILTLSSLCIQPLKADEGCSTCPGAGYYGCRTACCYAAGIVIGTALFVGMVAIVVNESHCSHSSHAGNHHHHHRHNQNHR